MVTEQELLRGIDLHQKQATTLQQYIQEFIKNPRYDLATRWNVFERACKAHLLPAHTWIQHTPTLDKLDVSWYDDFYKERYATVEWPDIIEQVEDSDNDGRIKSHIDQIKEEILAAGFYGFILDW